MTEQRRFHNALRILCNIDKPDWMTDEQWRWFNANPHDFYIKCGDEIEDKLWAIIEARQPKEKS